MAELLGKRPLDGDAPFRCSEDGARWIASGALTFASAGAALAAAKALPLPAAGIVECDGIAAVDSAAVALFLSLRRRAAKAGAPLAFVNAPAALTTLATLYGVEEMLEA